MAKPDNHDHAQSAPIRRSTRTVGLRIAALTGVVISAGAIATATISGDPDGRADLRIDTVVAGGSTPPGSTCCGPK